MLNYITLHGPEYFIFEPISKYQTDKYFILDVKESQWAEWYTYVEKSSDYSNSPYTIYSKINRNTIEWKLRVYPALVWIEYKNHPDDITPMSTERLEVNNLEHLEEIQSYLEGKVQKRQELARNNLTKENLERVYDNIQLASNDWWWWDWYIENLKWFSEQELASNIEFFSEILFNYYLENDINFKENFTKEHTTQKESKISEIKLVLWRDLTLQEIQQISEDISHWLKKWIPKATEDYLMQYIDLVWSLSNLSFDNVNNGVKWIWNKISNPSETLDWLAWEMLEFKNKMSQASDLIQWLWTYEYTYWWSYVWTTLWFVVWDPWGKLSALVWQSKFSQIWENTLIAIWKLQDAYKLKVIARFKDIEWVDDILSIAKNTQLPKVWNWWNAILIYWNKNTADGILDVLKSKDWKKIEESYLEWKWYVKKYISLDWKEWVNSRDFSTTKLDKFDTNITFDLLKFEGLTISKKELKFVTPKK